MKKWKTENTAVPICPHCGAEALTWSPIGCPRPFQCSQCKEDFIVKVTRVDYYYSTEKWNSEKFIEEQKRRHR